MRELVRNVFGGSPARALQSLLDGSKLDASELAQIRQVIQDAERKVAPNEKEEKAS
jgi:BlaI family penicillinase repressor